MAGLEISAMPADLRLLRFLLDNCRRGQRLTRQMYAPRLKRLGPVRVPTHFGFEIVVDPADHIGWAIAMHSTYESAVTELVRREVRPGGVFVDVGANHGWFALLAAAALKGSGGKVFAFEPQPRLAALLRESVARNGFAHVTVSETAAGEARRTGAVHPLSRESSGVVQVRPGAGEKGETRIMPLDEELAGVHPTCVKIDVEGYELRVLRGMRGILRSAALRCVVMELHAEMMRLIGDDCREVAELLAEAGLAAHALRMNRGFDDPLSTDRLAGDWWRRPPHHLCALRVGR